MPHSVSSKGVKLAIFGLSDWSDLGASVSVSRRGKAFTQFDFRAYISAA